MHAYLLVNPDSSFIDQKIKEVAGGACAIHYKLEKIADTRELVRQTNMSLATKTVYILDDFDTASTEAQNAFLKRLEEPADNLLFFLIVKNEARVLPTIASRCEVIRMKRKRMKSDMLREISFAEISKISKREDAIEYLENIINSLHEQLPESAKTLSYADEALSRIKANANPTLQLTRLAIGLQ